MIVNGGFDSDTVWNKQDTWTISGGKANCNGGLYQVFQVGAVAQKWYQVIFSVSSYTSGVCRARICEAVGPNISAVGTYTTIIQASGNYQSFGIESAAFVGSIDNVSVKEIIPADRSALGPELVSNGGFDSDTAWTKLTGASISGGNLILNHITATGALQNNLLVAGKTYKVALTVTNYISGDLRVEFGASIVIPSITATGTYSAIVQYSTSASLDRVYVC